MRVAMLVAGGIVFALALGLAYLVGRGISAPLNRIADVMRRLAGNELAGAIPAAAYKDEIGAMARAVQVFKDNAIENARLQREAEESQRRADDAQCATQTAKATHEITGQIGAVQSTAGEAVAAIRAISVTVHRVNEIAGAIAAAVEQQGTATKEIGANAQEAARRTEAVSAGIADVTHAAGETGATSEQMNGASGELARQAETLRREVDKFIAKVRAA